MEPRRVLVISHNCFSASGSNGRTLANFFKGYPTDKLAQFYIYNERPSSPVCDRYYRVTDAEAKRSLLHGGCGAQLHRVDAEADTAAAAEAVKKPRKTPFVYFVREWVWRLGRWKNRRLWQWIEEFSPEVVLFQAGDAAFLFDFARKVSKKYRIPLVIYNSESYYFKDKNFLATSRFSELWYAVLHRYFRRHAGRAIRHAKASVYISDSLRRLYDGAFGTHSVTVMTSTDLLETPPVPKTEGVTVSYLGNLGVGRHKSLLALGEILRSIDPTLTLSVYGNASEAIAKELCEAEGISYKGFVSYADCVRIMKESTLLVHAESFEEFFLEDSRYAFSTKIADCLASGTCLFVYAPSELSFTGYLRERKAAAVASDTDSAKQQLTALLENEDLRCAYAERAMQVARQNHSVDRNREIFLQTLQQE